MIITPPNGIIKAGDNPRVEVAVDAEKTRNISPQQVHEGTVQFYVQGLEGISALIEASLEADCLDNQPCVKLHTSRNNIIFGESTELSLAMSNPLAGQNLTVNLTLKIPDGWSLAPGDFNANCNSGLCTSNHSIPAGDKDEIQIVTSPNEPSSEIRESVFTGRVQWFYSDQETSTILDIAIPVTIERASQEVIAEFRRNSLATSVPAAVIVPAQGPAAPAAETALATGQTSPGQVAPTGFWANNNFLTLVIAGVVIILLLTFCFLILRALRGVNKVVQNQNTILEEQNRPYIAPSHNQQLPPDDDP